MRRLTSIVRRALGRDGTVPASAHAEFPDLGPRQLTMAIAGSAATQCELPEVPAGYCLRTFRPGDEASWLELLVVDFDDWHRQRLDAFLGEPERRQGSHVIEHGGRIVAATFASRAATQPPTATVDYVVCAPAHRGRKLGLIACGAVTRYLGESGYDSISLLTDDWRLAAIKIYFDLGFKPVVNRIDMAARWEAVRQQLETHTST